MTDNHVFKFKNFRNLFLASTTSELGGFITDTALMLFVFDLAHQNKVYLGILRASFLVALTIGGLSGGPIASRVNRKFLLIFCEIIRIPLIFLLMTFKTIPVLIIGSAAVAFFTGIFRPVKSSFLNEIVPPQKIKQANGFMATTNAILHLAAPMAGALIYAHYKGIKEVLFLDLFTYFFGIFILMNIKYKKNEDQKIINNSEFSHKFFEGFKYIKIRKDLYCISLNIFTAGLAIGILIPLLVPYISDVLKQDEKAYGLMMTFFGLGGIIGSWTTEKLTSYYPDGKLPYLSILIEPILFLLFLLNNNFILACTIFFIWGVIVFIRITSQMNLISDSVETKYLVKVHALLEIAFIIPNISGSLLVAIIGDNLSTLELLYGACFIFMVTIYARLPFPHMRALWTTQPTIVEREVQT